MGNREQNWNFVRNKGIHPPPPLGMPSQVNKLIRQVQICGLLTTVTPSLRSLLYSPFHHFICLRWSVTRDTITQSDQSHWIKQIIALLRPGKWHLFACLETFAVSVWSVLVLTDSWVVIKRIQITPSSNSMQKIKHRYGHNIVLINFHAAITLGSISAAISSPVFDPPQTVAGNRANDHTVQERL